MKHDVKGVEVDVALVAEREQDDNERREQLDGENGHDEAEGDGAGSLSFCHGAAPDLPGGRRPGGSRVRAWFQSPGRRRPRGIELFAQVGDVGLDDVGVVLPVVVVEVLEQFALADDYARAVDEVFEDAVFGGREVDEDAGAADGLLQRVDLHTESVERGVRRAFAAADEGLGAGDELAEVEGLGQVVVGAGVEQLNDGVAPSLAVRMRTGVASWRARRRSRPRPSSLGSIRSRMMRS